MADESLTYNNQNIKNVKGLEWPLKSSKRNETSNTPCEEDDRQASE